MAELTIPNLDESVIQRLKQIAWREGLPFEESVRRLLVRAASAKTMSHARISPARHEPLDCAGSLN